MNTRILKALKLFLRPRAVGVEVSHPGQWLSSRKASTCRHERRAHTDAASTFDAEMKEILEGKYAPLNSLQTDQLDKRSSSSGSDVLELMEHTESWRSYLQDICTSKERSSRSVAIQCVEKFSGAVEPLCKEFGQVNSIDWMILQQDNFILTALVEFESADSVRDLLSSEALAGTRTTKKLSTGSAGRILRVLRHKPSSSGSRRADRKATLKLAEANTQKLRRPEVETVQRALKTADNLGGYVSALHQLTEMDELQARLNYFSCQRIDDALGSSFPLCATLPHGSMVSRMATRGSDLDMVCHPFGLDIYSSIKDSESLVSDKTVIAWVKEWSSLDRNFQKQMISYLGFLVKFVIPSCVSTLVVPHARIPIVRFSDTLSNCRCDIQIDLDRNTSLAASYMIHEMSLIDPRLRPLIASLKLWARKKKLTSDQPGNCLINFSLVHMVIFFLQQTQSLPSAKDMYKNGSHISSESRTSTQDLDLKDVGELYIELFKFWSKFDYDQVIDVLSGNCFPHDSNKGGVFSSPLKISNSTDPSFNISYRTSADYLNRFRVHAKNTAQKLAETADHETFINLHYKS